MIVLVANINTEASLISADFDSDSTFTNFFVFSIFKEAKGDYSR